MSICDAVWTSFDRTRAQTAGSSAGGLRDKRQKNQRGDNDSDLAEFNNLIGYLNHKHIISLRLVSGDEKMLFDFICLVGWRNDVDRRWRGALDKSGDVC